MVNTPSQKQVTAFLLITLPIVLQSLVVLIYRHCQQISSNHAVFSLSCLLLQVQFECLCCTGLSIYTQQSKKFSGLPLPWEELSVFHISYSYIPPLFNPEYYDIAIIGGATLFHPTDCDYNFLYVYQKDVAVPCTSHTFKRLIRTENC